MTTTPPAAAPVKVEQIKAGPMYMSFLNGMEAAAEICGSLAETTYDDADAFEAATGCEASIMRVVRDGREQEHMARLAAIASPGVPRDRLAEVLYELDGFYPPMPERDTSVWVAESAVAPHSGDCTKDPWPCMRCHAEEYRDRADNVLAKLAAAPTPEPIQGEDVARRRALEDMVALDEDMERLYPGWMTGKAKAAPSHPAADEEARAEEIYNLVYHHCVTKYDPKAGIRCVAAALRHRPVDAVDSLIADEEARARLVARLIIGPRLPVPSTCKFTLEELQDIRWAQASNQDRTAALSLGKVIVAALGKRS